MHFMNFNTLAIKRMLLTKITFSEEESIHFFHRENSQVKFFMLRYNKLLTKDKANKHALA